MTIWWNLIKTILLSIGFSTMKTLFDKLSKSLLKSKKLIIDWFTTELVDLLLQAKTTVDRVSFFFVF